MISISNQIITTPPEIAQDPSIDEPSIPQELKIVLQPYQLRMREVGKKDVIAMWKRTPRFLTVTSEASVEHICRYIVTRMLVESLPPVLDQEFDVGNIEVFLRMGKDQFEKLNHEDTLAKVYWVYWNIKRPLDMVFAIAGDIQFRKTSTI